MTPDIIWHAVLSLKWEVVRVLEDWTTPEYWAVLGTPERRGDSRSVCAAHCQAARPRPASS